MKVFTAPKALFIMLIPIDWQYKNIEIGHEEAPPYSFQPYKDAVGGFQISCYSKYEKPVNTRLKSQKFNTKNLDFVTSRMDGEGFNVHLWYAIVEDHFFMAKYIYESTKEHDSCIIEELKKVEEVLSTLELVSEERRALLLDIDKYEKFIASLSASFDIKKKAMETESLIELLVILANQIDAYLRMAIVLKKQLDEKSNKIDISFLYQGENDPPMMERKIYKIALQQRIISQDVFSKLEHLYKQRNKVIHRYIISDIKTRHLYQIAYDYELLSETIRGCLEQVENCQFLEKVGIYGMRSRDKDESPSEEDINILHSQINDKHLVKEFYRNISSKSK